MISFAEVLRAEIERITENLPLSILAKESEILSSHYRSHQWSLATDNQRLAYLVCRLPATYAAVQYVLHELVKRGFNDSLETLLDVGAGPGTALWAAASLFPSLKIGILLEWDEGFIALGKRLAKALPRPIEIEYQKRDIRKEWDAAAHDLVIASYSLGELEEKERLAVLDTLWLKTKKTLVIIEPGTPRGFSHLLTMRKHLLEQGAHLAAPCPSSGACPVEGKEWCHFYARLDRSSLHRKVKGGTLNYEDEKFSYLVFTKEPINPCEARVVRHPFKGSGFVKLKICHQSQIKEMTITRKEKEYFHYIKKIEWGDSASLK
jgi:ribosomal protein RSM22 (predicted rRNA methylase)